MDLTIVTPVFNDWDCFHKLVSDIHALDLSAGITVRILAINDSSFPARVADITPLHDGCVASVTVVNLLRNIGHQRAIAVGLVEVAANRPTDSVIVMDSDGEDRVSDIPRLLAASVERPQAIIVARRERRSEGMLFRLAYFAYKRLFALLTGETIDFGNFCLIPYSMLAHLVSSAELWNHLSATVNRSHLPTVRLPTHRARRYFGQSKMRFSSLVLHGLSAVSVYSEIVFARLFIASGGLAALAFACILLVIGVRYFTVLAIPGWATFVVGLLLVIAVQSLAFSGGLAFVVLTSRSLPFLIPLLEAPKLVKSYQSVFKRTQETPIE